MAENERKRRSDAGKPRMATLKEFFARFAQFPPAVRATIPAALEALDESLSRRPEEVQQEELPQ
jgi:hypothetical protein